MSYTDFKTLETIKSLNDFLKDKSYVDNGYVPIACLEFFFLDPFPTLSVPLLNLGPPINQLGLYSQT